jgi:hypothetical protein
MDYRAKFSAVLFFLTVVFILPVISEAGPIKWEAYKDGMMRAKTEKKKIFVNFYADW